MAYAQLHNCGDYMVVRLTFDYRWSYPLKKLKKRKIINNAYHKIYYERYDVRRYTMDRKVPP